MDSSLWIFGYGSLMWKPGFHYDHSQIGCIHGFSRRFWQENVTHRGTFDRPGLVATLVENEEKEVWGVAFKVTGTQQIKDALDYLDIRENVLGGYKIFICEFFPKDCIKTLPVLVHIATADNPLFVGSLPLETIAQQISSTQGACGHNVEYLIRTADFVREQMPWVHDDHLFRLDNLVKKILHQKNISVTSLLKPTLNSSSLETKLSQLINVNH